MEIKRVFDLLDHYVEKYPNQQVALAGKKNGQWINYSSKSYKEHADILSYALIELGIEKGDKVAMILTNRPEWNMLDMAIMQVGAISVPVYPTISENDYRYIINHSDMRLVFVEGVEVMNKIKAIQPDSPNLSWIYTFMDRGEFPYLDQLIEMGSQHQDPDALQARRDAVKPEDCSTIMYTSGTTGCPKGVMLSHYNIVSQILNLRHTPAKWSNRAFSFLPLCHAYERMLVFLYQHLGMSVFYAQNLGTIAENLKEVCPTMMSAVPRVLEKFYDKIWSSSKNLPSMQKKIFRWAIRLGERYKIQDSERSFIYNCKHHIADKLVYSKIRKAIGGNFDIVVSGAASIQPRLASFFSAIGMPVYEGYGATETSPVIAVSCRDKYGREAGTVGFALPGVEIRISEEGELLCRGHNVMMGYYKDEEQTRRVIDADGWFHTGDMGKINELGQVMITGRLKSLFKTSFGKYVNPQMIEEKFCESPFVENMLVVGENQKFAAAIIQPDFEVLKGWCASHQVPFVDNASVIKDEVVLKRFQEEVAKYNAELGETEKIKKFHLVPEQWTQKNNILTPTLKVKRHVAQKIYQAEIEQLFK